MARKVIKIKDEILKSFRYAARMKKEDVVNHFQKKTKRKFGILSEADLKNIESADAEVPLTLLKEFAVLYKYPLSCFLLSKPLKEDPIPTDFRKLPAGYKGILSQAGALALRSARRSQYIANFLNSPNEDNKLPSALISDSPEQLAQKVRDLMGITFDSQKKHKSPYSFFVFLRERLEELGAIVLKLTFPLEDARAFSVTDAKPYVVVINNKDGTENGYSPKVFSLMHEFGHLLLRDGGLCNDFSDEAQQASELFCNAFSASFLVPEDSLEIALKEFKFQSLSHDEQVLAIDEIKKRFQVSGEVIVRRLHSLKHISWKEMELLVKEVNDLMRSKRRDSYIPRLSEAQKCLGRNGNRYTQFVLEGVSRGLITPEHATDGLGIKVKHLHDLGKLAASR